MRFISYYFLCYNSTRAGPLCPSQRPLAVSSGRLAPFRSQFHDLGPCGSLGGLHCSGLRADCYAKRLSGGSPPARRITLSDRDRSPFGPLRTPPDRVSQHAAGISPSGVGVVSRRFLCEDGRDRKSTRLNSSHQIISYAVFCLKKKKNRTGR